MNAAALQCVNGKFCRAAAKDLSRFATNGTTLPEERAAPSGAKAVECRHRAWRRPVPWRNGSAGPAQQLREVRSVGSDQLQGRGRPARWR